MPARPLGVRRVVGTEAPSEKASSSAPPIRLLLVGRGWRSLKPMLESLAESRRFDVTELDPEAAPDAGPPAGAALLVAAGGRDVLGLRRLLARWEGHQRPPVLACVSSYALETFSPDDWADDFVVVPCAALEMERRIQRILLRRGGPEQTGPPLGELTLDADQLQATLAGRSVRLTPMEFRLLRHLLQHAGRVCTRSRLLAEVWGPDYTGGARTLDVHIRRLRHKLGRYAQQHLRTVRNVGYGILHGEGLGRLATEEGAQGADVLL